MRRDIPASVVSVEHRDFEIIDKIENEILLRAGGPEKLRDFFSAMLRDEIDKLIDTANTDRRSYASLEKVEKTYIGTRVEIRLRKFWDLPKGRLDFIVQHQDVDLKHTMGRAWMIPTEAIGHPCILTAADEKTAKCYMGIFVAHSEYLTLGLNKDQKAQIAAQAWANIRWVLADVAYPSNFWRTLDSEIVAYIFEGESGAERVRRLFRRVLDRPIPRKVVIDAAQQLDPIKRVRKNGGARDQMLREGILILSGDYDRAKISKLSLPFCAPGEFIAHKMR